MRWWRFSLLIGLVIPTVLSAQGRFFDSNGVQLYYIEHGSGEPLVLLHGRTTNLDLWTATGLLEQLSDRLSGGRI